MRIKHFALRLAQCEQQSTMCLINQSVAKSLMTLCKSLNDLRLSVRHPYAPG
jgi:hypothetical protein